MTARVTHADGPDRRQTAVESDEWDDDPEKPCTYLFCEDGYWWGSELGDLLRYDPDQLYPCPSCHGSGLAKDMTLW